MRIAALHPSLNVGGGAEKYAVYLIKALMDLRLGDIDLYVLEKTVQQEIKNILGTHVNEVCLKPLLKTGTIYDLLIKAYSFKRVVKALSERYDLIINTKANEIPLTTDLCVVHYPLGHALYAWDKVSLGAGVDPKYITTLPWKLYIQPFRILFYRLSRNIEKCSTILVNSKFTAQILQELTEIKPIVLYPPIDIASIMQKYDGYSKRFSRTNSVVTISRFDASKNLELVPFVAKHIPEGRFIIIGRIDNAASLRYYLKIKRLRDRLKLNNVSFLPNLGEDAKFALLAKAKACLHPAIGEHFGISVLEALCCGAVPVVHRFSGARIDIQEDDRFGFCFNSPYEAIHAIKSILHGDLSIEDPSDKLKSFSYENFLKKLRVVIQRALESKSRRLTTCAV